MVKHQEFLDLNVDSIIQLLKNENLNVSSEDAVFDALKKWVIFDLNRNEYIPTLLQYIKLPLVTPGVSFLYYFSNFESIFEISFFSKILNRSAPIILIV